ncbi:MAG: sensor histidine kinase [Bacteroidia bacterium]|nr:sensor histidine kinase [Bacteroidia bacterium]
MKKYIFLFSFLTCIVAVPALGQSRIDSLEQVLRKGNLSDSSRIRATVSLSMEYEYMDFNKAKSLAQEAVKLVEESNLSAMKTVAYRNLATVYRIGGDFSSALRYDNQALQSSITMLDSAAIPANYNNLANDYFDLGEYDDAYYYFTKAYRVAGSRNDSLVMAVALHNVGRVFKELGQYDRALDHLTISRKLSRLIGDVEGEAYSLGEIGDIQMTKGDYDSALFTLMQSLEETRILNLHILEPDVLTKIASVHLHLEDYARSLAYFDSAYALHSKTANKYGNAEVLLGKGMAYLKLGQYDEAQRAIEQSAAVAATLNARILEIQANEALSQLWEMKGDYHKSLQFFRQFKALEDSLFSQEMQEKLSRDQIRFETESRDSQIAMLSELEASKTSALKRQEFIRNILAVVVALSGILLVTVYRSGQRRKQINKLLLQHQDEMERRSDELERLNQVKDKFFSIISHDLRSPINALAGILDLMTKDAIRPEDFAELTQELRMRFNHTRTLLNNMLDWTLLQMDKLNLQAAKIDLHRIVNENIQLSGAILSKKIELVNEVPKNAIGFADSNTVNLVIRNLMTNAIKFTNDGGEVRIGAEAKGKEWIMWVKDNGVGIDKEIVDILFDKTAPYSTRGTANEKGTGLGLILCKEFIEKNGGKIWVESEVGRGSTFWFTLPMA